MATKLKPTKTYTTVQVASAQKRTQDSIKNAMCSKHFMVANIVQPKVQTMHSERPLVQFKLH